MIEKHLRKVILSLADAFQAHQPLTDKTLSARIHGDMLFLEGLRQAEKDEARGRVLSRHRGSFTIRKFDQAVQNFSDHWPEGLQWPAPPTLLVGKRPALSDQGKLLAEDAKQKRLARERREADAAKKKKQKSSSSKRR